MDAQSANPATPTRAPVWRPGLVWAAVFFFVFTFTTTALAVCAGLPLVARGTGSTEGEVTWLVAGWWAVAAITVAQRLAMASSLALGLPPDNPFPGGEVNRVVQGVTVHPLPSAS